MDNLESKFEAFKTETRVANEVNRIELQQALKEFKRDILEYIRLEILAAHFHMDSNHE